MKFLALVFAAIVAVAAAANSTETTESIGVMSIGSCPNQHDKLNCISNSMHHCHWLEDSRRCVGSRRVLEDVNATDSATETADESIVILDAVCSTRHGALACNSTKHCRWNSSAKRCNHVN